MTYCSRCGELERRIPQGKHTQKCKDYRKNYYLKNRKRILEWMRDYNRKRVSPQKKLENRKKYREYYLAYSKWWYWGNKVEELKKRSGVFLPIICWNGSSRKNRTHTHTHTQQKQN